MKSEDVGIIIWFNRKLYIAEALEAEVRAINITRL